MLDVVTLGEAMVLLVADAPGPLDTAVGFVKRIAGAETNVAIGLARLGLRVAWMSRVGEDSMGRYLLSELRREGVDCSRVRSDPAHDTGLMFKACVDDGSDPPVEYHRRGSAASRMAPQDLDADGLASARHLHATGIFPALSDSCFEAARYSLQVMRGAGRSISFDPNLRPTLWSSTTRMREAVNELAAQADWVLPGMEEGRYLTGEATPQGVARFYRDRGAKLVIVKLGPAGAYFEGDGGAGWIPGFPVDKVVDSVGAGDGFAVGVISALIAGRPPADAARRGAWIGARAVQFPGDSDGLPTDVELASVGL